MRERLSSARLYLLATTAVARRPLLEAVALAVDGGVDVVQLREKTMDDGEFLALADDMSLLCAAKDVLFVINDRAEAARATGAVGLHVGQEDLSVRDARRVVGADGIVGVSTHDGDELAAAIADGADYVGVGSVFPTATKGRDVPVSGPETLGPLARRAESIGLPAFAIGGITPANAARVVAAGFSRLAVCAGVLADDDPRAAAASLRRALLAAPQVR